MLDMNEFLELAHRAGIGTLNSLAIAEALEISTSYVQKLRSGSAPVRPPIRAKLDALIAAKENCPEPVESKHVLEHGEIRERVEQFEVDLQAESLVIGTGYRVEGVPGGGYRITQTVAECVDQAFARVICGLLNGERD